MTIENLEDKVNNLENSKFWNKNSIVGTFKRLLHVSRLLKIGSGSRTKTTRNGKRSHSSLSAGSMINSMKS